MPRKKLQLEDFKTKNPPLNNAQLNATKGGYRYISSGLGSFGQLSWSEIDVRASNFQYFLDYKNMAEVSSSVQHSALSTKKTL